MANVFARLYFAKIERGFRKWQTQISFDKHRARLIKNLIDLYIKNKFYRAKSALENWANHARRIELKELIAQSTREGNIET
jgi:hypothetical protein